MRVRKSMGKVIGADLNKTEQRALNMEIRKELAEWDMKNLREIDAIFLWELHTQLGFGVDRLKKFFMGFSNGVRELAERYEMDDTDDDRIWICQKKLEELGVDMDAWWSEIAYRDLEKLEGDQNG